MRKPSLSYETILAALVVVSGGSVVACSKADRAAGARADPSPIASASASPVVATPASFSSAVGAPGATDAGDKRTPPRVNASAGCGASGCSPDMKKGN